MNLEVRFPKGLALPSSPHPLPMPSWDQTSSLQSPEFPLRGERVLHSPFGILTSLARVQVRRASSDLPRPHRKTTGHVSFSPDMASFPTCGLTGLPTTREGRTVHYSLPSWESYARSALQALSVGQSPDVCRPCVQGEMTMNPVPPSLFRAEPGHVISAGWCSQLPVHATPRESPCSAQPNGSELQSEPAPAHTGRPQGMSFLRDMASFPACGRIGLPTTREDRTVGYDFVLQKSCARSAKRREKWGST